jgi:RNA polymerase sigma-70 factor, ECF subfamily
VIDSIQVFEALRKLSEEHREVVVQLFFQHRSTREIAMALDLPEGTVKSRTYYALQELRELLEVTT